MSNSTAEPDGLDPDPVTSIMASKLPHYTTEGFRLMATPPRIHERLHDAYTSGLPSARAEDSDPNYLTAGDPAFIDIGDLAYQVGAELQDIHESWSGQPLELVAAYGIRTYRRGQVLRRHCDRVDTHVISSIVHIDNESDEQWPLHIEDHDGVVHRVVLEPGQMLLYESATCPHARPTPFEGEHYGSLFVHFKPLTGWHFTVEDVLQFLEQDSTGRE